MMRCDMLYLRVSEIEPPFPTQGRERLDDLGFQLGQRSAALGYAVHPITREGMVEVVRASRCRWTASSERGRPCFCAFPRFHLSEKRTIARTSPSPRPPLLPAPLRLPSATSAIAEG